MDRNNIIGLVLIFAIFAGSFYLMKPSEGEMKQEQALQDSLKHVREGTLPIDTSKTTANTTLDSADFKKPFGATKVGQEQVVKLENDLLAVEISTKGGKVKSVLLKGEKNYDEGPLYIINGENNKFGFLFKAAGENINTNDLYFTVTNPSATAVTLRLNYSASQYIDYTYTLQPKQYNVGLQVNAVGIQNLVDLKQKSITLNWESSLLQKELNIKSEREKSTVFYKDVNDDVDNLSETGDDEEIIEEKVKWIAFKQHFFSAILSSKQTFENTELKVAYHSDGEVVKTYQTSADLVFNSQANNQYDFNFFFGPNQYKILKAEKNDYQKIINMGWGPISWINIFMTVPLFDFLDGFKMSYGIVILILTLLLKGLMFPLTYKSYLSMAKMRVLKPQLDEIKEKVGADNPMLLQQEQMKLYKQAGVNPLGGCLPMLLQMPFTLAFFFFFPNLFELRGESFLWMKDLSTYDAPITFAPIFGINHISLMCILMTATTLLTTWYNNATSGAAANAQMKYIGYIMPLLFFFMLNSFPSGLNYYYFLGAVFTFLTQLIIRSFIDDDKILARLEDNKKNPKVQKKSSFQQRMEDMMRQQQAAQQKKGK